MPGTVYNNTISTTAVPDSSALHPAFIKIGNGPGSAAGITALAGAQLLAQLFESDDEETNDEDEGEEPDSTAVYPTSLQNDNCKFFFHSEFIFAWYLISHDRHVQYIYGNG